MDPYAEDQPTRASRGTFIWIVLISGIFLLSGFIPLVLMGRSNPNEKMYRNCVQGESGVHIGDRLVIEYSEGLPIVVSYPEINSVPDDVQQLCFDLIVRADLYG
ncbi:MAG: hypothetical protein M3132_14145 [Actinomycetia bacterium]|nr:hypothetical protein [Actinomycetes bacterium]